MKSSSYIGGRVPSASRGGNNPAAQMAFALAEESSSVLMQDSVMSGISGLKGGYSSA
jgi:hypothetical protein